MHTTGMSFKAIGRQMGNHYSVVSRLVVLIDRLLFGSQCCLSTGLDANGIRLIKRCNALSSRSDVTRDLPDLGKSFTLLVCVCVFSPVVLLLPLENLLSNMYALPYIRKEKS
jgi:hypothetical protein